MDNYFVDCVQRWDVLTWFLRVTRGWSAVTTWQQSAVTWLVRHGYLPVITPADGPEPSATAHNVRLFYWVRPINCRLIFIIIIQAKVRKNLGRNSSVYVYRTIQFLWTSLLGERHIVSLHKNVDCFVELLALRESSDVVIRPAESQQQAPEDVKGMRFVWRQRW